MADVSKTPETRAKRRPPATTPEARENQLIASAMDMAERQFDSDTASAQVMLHFLKLGSTRERKEQRKLELENDLLIAKAEAMASEVRTEEMYKNALTAISAYQGRDDEQFDD